MDFLDVISQRTVEFIQRMPKALRKAYGQFFTGEQTARYMASMYCLPAESPATLRVLDAGAGSGMLAAALTLRLMAETSSRVSIVCYENDDNILPLLEQNLSELAALHPGRIDYETRDTNFILSNRDNYQPNLFSAESEAFDYVIGNPPYKKMPKEAPEALAMPHVCHGAPNLYFLFMAAGVSLMAPEAQMTYIIPRSWTSGTYFEKFRQYLFSHAVMERVHLFGSRDKVFEKESVLQETMIVTLRKTTLKPDHVLITTTPTSSDFSRPEQVQAPYDLVVSGPQHYVFLTTSQEEIDNLQTINALPFTLPALGLRMKTGLVVDFRSKDALRDQQAEDTVPLIYSTHIREGRVQFPMGREHEYICADRRGIVQENKNYLIMKRFTAKEEPRRLQCGVYLKRNLPEYHYISTQNKVNFVDSDRELSECVVFGLYVLFNSHSYDLYYRILNGSTQVNSTEINNMPVPELSVIEKMGKEIIGTHDMSELNCNRIFKRYIA